MSKNVIVSVNGEEEARKITVKEAKEKAKAFSPYSNWKENTYFQERNEIIRDSKRSDIVIGFDLEDLIQFLQGVHSKFGNMPVLYFSGTKECFRTFDLHDIDIVKSYFTVACNMSNQYMKIENKSALSFFHV